MTSSPAVWPPTRTPGSGSSPMSGRSTAPSPMSSTWHAGWPRVCANGVSARATSWSCNCPTGPRRRRPSGPRPYSERWWYRSCISTAARNWATFWAPASPPSSSPPSISGTWTITRTCARTSPSSDWWEAISTTYSPMSRCRAWCGPTRPVRRSSPSPPEPPATPRESCTAIRHSGSKPTSCWRTMRRIAAIRSPPPRWGTSSACSAPS